MTEHTDQPDPTSRPIAVLRPLAVLAIRATGNDPDFDRIVEIAVIRAAPQTEDVHFYTLVDPGPVTPRVAACPYAITGKKARGLPTFDRIAHKLVELLDRCDLVGFDLRTALPLLRSELRYVGLDLPMAERGLIDVGEVYRHQESRGFEDAVAHYLKQDLWLPHDMKMAARLTAQMLMAQLGGDPGLPADPRRLHDMLGKQGVGPGLIRREPARWVIEWGRHAGRTLGMVAVRDPRFLRALLTNDLAPDVRAAVSEALERAGELKTSKPNGPG